MAARIAGVTTRRSLARQSHPDFERRARNDSRKLVQSSKWRNLARAARRSCRWLALWLAARPAWADPGGLQTSFPGDGTVGAPGAAPSAAAAPAPPAAVTAPAAPPSPSDPGEAVEAAHAAFQRGKALRESGDLP